ncbi:MAG: DNA polymerase III subunit delta [Anaerolineae bacterium]
MFHGEDDAKARGRGRQTSGHDAQHNGELNMVEFEGVNVSAPELISASSAYPFLADKRMVIVKGFISHITRKGAGETGKKAVDYLLEALPELPPYARLVFAEREALPENSKLVKLAADKGFAKLYSAPKDSTGWIQKRAKDYYKTSITPRAAAALASVTPEDLRRADSELFKLVSYAEGREITEDDVALLTPYVQEANTFAMVDALAEGRAGDATRLLHRLLDDREDPFAVYGMIVRQFRLLLLAKEHLTSPGGSPSTVANALGIKPYPAEKISKQSRAFSVPQLEKIYRTLADYDVKMKTGRIEPVLALDLLIASLAR